MALHLQYTECPEIGGEASTLTETGMEGLVIRYPDGNCNITNVAISWTGSDGFLLDNEDSPFAENEITFTDCAFENIGLIGMYLLYPESNVTLDNVTIDGTGEDGIRAAGLSGSPFRDITVAESHISGCADDGIHLNGKFALFIERGAGIDPTVIEDCEDTGIYMSGNTGAVFGQISNITNADILHCSSSASSVEGGVYLSNSNPILDGIFIHENGKYGIYLSSNARPRIGDATIWPPDYFTNIINNGPAGNQGTSTGAEIRFGSTTNCGLTDNQMRYASIYDIRTNGGLHRRGPHNFQRKCRGSN